MENNWVPEEKLPALLGWADVLLLTHTQASQSGVAAAALGAGRFVVATDVGGLAAQLHGVQGAVLCPPDAAALAEAVRTLPAAPPPRLDVAAMWQNFAAELLDHAVAGRADAGYTARRTREQDSAPCPSASRPSMR